MPSIVYGLLAVAAMALIGFNDTGVVLGGAIALALLILPVIIITTREALRAVPQRDPVRARWRSAPRCGRPPGGRPCPRPIPGIATGTILGLSRAIGEAAPLLISASRARCASTPTAC